MLEKKVTNQDLATENQIRLVREEIDIILSRLNSKDQKGSDMLDQVIDIEQKVVQAQKNVKAIDNSILKKVDEIKRYCELVLPAEQSRLMFEQLQEIFEGKHFNKCREAKIKYIEQLTENLQNYQNGDTKEKSNETQNLLPQTFDLELFTIPDQVEEPVEKSIQPMSNYGNRGPNLDKVSNLNVVAPRQRRMTIARKAGKDNISQGIKKQSASQKSP